MKNLIFTLALTLMVASLHAQTELKINPIGAIFLQPDVSAEFGVGENISVEPTLGLSWINLTIDNSKLKSSGFNYGVNGKYYFGPDKGLDKFYAGVYLRGGQSKFSGDAADDKVSRSRLGAGISLGYKWLSNRNVVFEIATGLGRKIFDKWSDAGNGVNTATIPLFNIDGFFKFNVGYRFGGGSGSGSSKRK